MKRVCFVLFCFVLLINCKNTSEGEGKVMSKEILGKKEIEKMLHEVISNNSTKNEIVTFLNKQKIENGYDDETKKIFAIVRDVKKDKYVSTSVQVIFELDANNKLLNYVVKEVRTGP